MENKIYILLVFFVILFGCEKNNDPINNESKTTTELKQISSCKINYSIIVTNAENSQLHKSLNETDFAKVYVINQNSDTLSASTDERGIATFANLYPGLVIVKIEKTNYTKVELTVELQNDTETDLVYASTMVTIFHIAGENNLCTIKGNAYAQLDVTVRHEPWSVGNSHTIESTVLEFAPQGTQIKAIIDDISFNSFIFTEGNGKVIDYTYYNIEFTGIVSENGKFEIDVPASNKKLNYSILPVDFEYAITYSALQYYEDQQTVLTDAYGNNLLETQSEEHVFSSTIFQLSILGYNNIFYTEDIIFDYIGSINNTTYFGDIY